MKIKIILIFFVFILSFGINQKTFLLSEKKPQKTKVKKLEEKYRKWLELVYYIITGVEKDVFLKLTTNRDRDAFINLFWKQRDPTKGTPENEYKDEHIKRFNWANHRFKYGTPKPGWKTDRGRIYILLGPPLSENEILRNEIRPTLIWNYLGSPENRLPTSFNIVFYKKDGIGEYKLYIPIEDGPRSLLTPSVGELPSSDQFRELYYKIEEIEPAVAEIALSLIPGEPMIGFSPSLKDPIFLSRVFEMPIRKINATYAQSFLSLKGIVDVDVFINYVNCKADLYILKNPFIDQDLNFIHFAIHPNQISIDYTSETDKYYFNYDLTVILNKGDNNIYQYSKKFPFYFTKEDLKTKYSYGIIIIDFFPIIDGKFNLKLILQNSINREISYFEKEINSTHANKFLPSVFGPIISYQVNDSSQSVLAPFNITNKIIKVDPAKEFGFKETLNAYFGMNRGNNNQKIKIELEIKDKFDEKKYIKKYYYQLPEYKNFFYFIQQLEKLNPGFYTVSVKAIGKKDTILDLKEKDFTVSPRTTIAHPPTASRKMGVENKYIFYLIIAKQWLNVKDTVKAKKYFEKAYDLNQKFPDLLKSYASLLLEQKEYDKLLEIIENLRSQKKYLFDYHAFRGKAYYYKGNYQLAVEDLLKANNIYDSDIYVLNTLGMCFVKQNLLEEAKKVLSASIKINPKQKKVSDLLDQLKEKK